MLNILETLFKRRPDPIIDDLRQKHRETMQAIRQLTLAQFKKDLEAYSAEIDWENPSGRKPEPAEAGAVAAAHPDQPEPGEPGAEAQPQLLAAGDDAAGGADR